MIIYSGTMMSLLKLTEIEVLDRPSFQLIRNASGGLPEPRGFFATSTQPLAIAVFREMEGRECGRPHPNHWNELLRVTTVSTINHARNSYKRLHIGTRTITISTSPRPPHTVRRTLTQMHTHAHTKLKNLNAALAEGQTPRKNPRLLLLLLLRLGRRARRRWARCFYVN